MKLLKFMKIKIYCLCFFTAFAPSSHGQDLETTKKSLKIISDFASDICGESVKLQGDSDNIDLSGNAKAKLNNAIAKVVDLGVEGAAKYQSEKYNGPLRTDLIAAMTKSQNCKLEVWKDLKNKLLEDSQDVLNDNPTLEDHNSIELTQVDEADHTREKKL